MLTQWLGQPPEDTSWEPWQELRNTYHLEDKVVFEEGGIVSNTPDFIIDPTAEPNPAEPNPAEPPHQEEHFNWSGILRIYLKDSVEKKSLNHFFRSFSEVILTSKPFS